MWRSLKHHPGVKFAAILTFLGAVIGFKSHGEWIVALVGAAIMSVFWIPVLITAWTGREK